MIRDYKTMAADGLKLDALIDDNAMLVNDPFCMGSRNYYLLDTNGVLDDVGGDSLRDALAEAMALPSNVSLNDVLAMLG